MHHVIGCRVLFESRIRKIDYGIINVEVRGIFGIGCLRYNGISGVNGLFGREVSRSRRGK